MKVDIWRECNGDKYIRSLSATAWRIVEAQYITSTRKLVDSLEEQAILEDLIETSKPQLKLQHEGFHPLLNTAFRYPPLEYGSRFGRQFEHSIWYGSIAIRTAMAEKAFYQFNFLRASKADYGIVEIPLTAFSTNIKTHKGIKLTEPPFVSYTDIISSAISYENSQTLGAAMRHANADAFSYQSARDPEHGVNVGLFSSKAFASKEPNQSSFQSWLCVATPHLIEFVRSSVGVAENLSFPIETFLVNGLMPFPPN